MEKMLVTQALNELKLLDARIRKEIHSSRFVGSARTASETVNGKTKDEFEKTAKANFDSINDLIDRRMKIKKAIILSNAQTKVTFDDKEYTVAELIDMKASITYQEQLLVTMRNQYDNGSKDVNRNNEIMQDKIDKLIETSIGTEKKKSDDNSDIESITTIYRKNNEHSLVDPINVLEKIEVLEKYIMNFKSNVDSILQISNCTTTIEI